MEENKMDNYGDVLLPEDVMNILHIGRNTTYRYLSNGTIRSIRLAGKYRIPKQFLEEFLSRK